MGRFYVELYMPIFLRHNFSQVLGFLNSVVDSDDDDDDDSVTEVLRDFKS